MGNRMQTMGLNFIDVLKSTLQIIQEGEVKVKYSSRQKNEHVDKGASSISTEVTKLFQNLDVEDLSDEERSRARSRKSPEGISSNWKRSPRKHR